MTELKGKFLELSKIAIIEFGCNHPGKHNAAHMLEALMDLTEEEIVEAAEANKGRLAPAVRDLIFYMFTGGRSKSFGKPKWLQTKVLQWIVVDEKKKKDKKKEEAQVEIAAKLPSELSPRLDAEDNTEMLKEQTAS